MKKRFILLGSCLILVIAFVAEGPLVSVIVSVLERQVFEPFLAPILAILTSVGSGVATRAFRLRSRHATDELRNVVKHAYREILNAYFEGGPYGPERAIT